MSPIRSWIWSMISAMLGQLLVAPNITSFVFLLLFSPVACAMPTPSRRDSTPEISDGSSGQSKQFIIVGAVSGSVVGLAVLVALFRWWKRRREEKSAMGAKEEDRMPLSASFQPGELPTLSYLPEPKSPTVEGIA